MAKYLSKCLKCGEVYEAYTGGLPWFSVYCQFDENSVEDEPVEKKEKSETSK